MKNTQPMRVLSALALATYLVLRGCIRLVSGLLTIWRWLPRRPSKPGFGFVYVNQDGTARELSPREQRCLKQDFTSGDSGRPYVKFTYESRDAWGSRSGFLARLGLPRRIRVQAVHPDYDTRLAATMPSTPFASLIREPGVSHWAWWRANCRNVLAEQKRYEALASIDHAPEREPVGKALHHPGSPL